MLWSRRFLGLLNTGRSYLGLCLLLLSILSLGIAILWSEFGGLDLLRAFGCLELMLFWGN